MSGDYRLETLDADGLVVRTPPEGQITMRMGGWGVAWVPDRRPGEAKLRVIRKSDGYVLAVGELTDYPADSPDRVVK